MDAEMPDADHTAPPRYVSDVPASPPSPPRSPSPPPPPAIHTPPTPHTPPGARVPYDPDLRFERTLDPDDEEPAAHILARLNDASGSIRQVRTAIMRIVASSEPGMSPAPWGWASA
jgi:hypothetical protein